MTKEEKLKKLHLIELRLKAIIDEFGILHCNFTNYMNLIYLLDEKAGNLFDNIQDHVISTQDASNIYFFARDVEGCNIQKFEDAIITTKNKYYILKFAELKGANKERLYSAAERLEKKPGKLERTTKKLEDNAETFEEEVEIFEENHKTL